MSKYKSWIEHVLEVYNNENYFKLYKEIQRLILKKNYLRMHLMNKSYYFLNNNRLVSITHDFLINTRYSITNKIRDLKLNLESNLNSSIKNILFLKTFSSEIDQLGEFHLSTLSNVKLPEIITEDNFDFLLNEIARYINIKELKVYIKKAIKTLKNIKSKFQIEFNNIIILFNKNCTPPFKSYLNQLNYTINQLEYDWFKSNNYLNIELYLKSIQTQLNLIKEMFYLPLGIDTTEKVYYILNMILMDNKLNNRFRKLLEEINSSNFNFTCIKSEINLNKRLLDKEFDKHKNYFLNNNTVSIKINTLYIYYNKKIDDLEVFIYKIILMNTEYEIINNEARELIKYLDGLKKLSVQFIPYLINKIQPYLNQLDLLIMRFYKIEFDFDNKDNIVQLFKINTLKLKMIKSELNTIEIILIQYIVQYIKNKIQFIEEKSKNEKYLDLKNYLLKIDVVKKFIDFNLDVSKFKDLEFDFILKILFDLNFSIEIDQYKEQKIEDLRYSLKLKLSHKIDSLNDSVIPKFNSLLMSFNTTMLQFNFTNKYILSVGLEKANSILANINDTLVSIENFIHVNKTIIKETIEFLATFNETLYDDYINIDKRNFDLNQYVLEEKFYSNLILDIEHSFDENCQVLSSIKDKLKLIKNDTLIIY